VKNKIIKIFGDYNSINEHSKFTGKIIFEDRIDCVYYTWSIKSNNGDFLGSVSMPVSKNIIPQKIDEFEFALKHAIENINQYKINRIKVFNVYKTVIQ